MVDWSRGIERWKHQTKDIGTEERRLLECGGVRRRRARVDEIVPTLNIGAFLVLGWCFLRLVFYYVVRITFDAVIWTCDCTWVPAPKSTPYLLLLKYCCCTLLYCCSFAVFDPARAKKWGLGCTGQRYTESQEDPSSIAMRSVQTRDTPPLTFLSVPCRSCWGLRYHKCNLMVAFRRALFARSNAGFCSARLMFSGGIIGGVG